MMDRDLLLDAMGCVDAAMVEEAACCRRKSKKWRPALIAACLCLALIGTAMAGEIISGGGGLLEFFRGQTFPQVDVLDPRDGYSVTNIGVKTLPVEDFSQQVQELAKNSTQDMVEMPFASWADAQRYLGVELMRNDVLERAERQAFGWGSEDNHVHCLLQVGTYDQLLRWAHLTATYGLGENVLVTVWASAYTEHTLVDANSIGITKAYDLNTVNMTQEEYTTANGTPATIVKVEHMQDGEPYTTTYDAYLAVNGIRYHVECGGGAGDAAMDALKEVLDAFR